MPFDKPIKKVFNWLNAIVYVSESGFGVHTKEERGNQDSHEQVATAWFGDPGFIDCAILGSEFVLAIGQSLYTIPISTVLAGGNLQGSETHWLNLDWPVVQVVGDVDYLVISNTQGVFLYHNASWLCIIKIPLYDLKIVNGILYGKSIVGELFSAKLATVGPLYLKATTLDCKLNAGSTYTGANSAIKIVDTNLYLFGNSVLSELFQFNPQTSFLERINISYPAYSIASVQRIVYSSVTNTFFILYASKWLREFELVGDDFALIGQVFIPFSSTPSVSTSGLACNNFGVFVNTTELFVVPFSTRVPSLVHTASSTTHSISSYGNHLYIIHGGFFYVYEGTHNPDPVLTLVQDLTDAVAATLTNVDNNYLVVRLTSTALFKLFSINVGGLLTALTVNLNGLSRTVSTTTTVASKTTLMYKTTTTRDKFSIINDVLEYVGIIDTTIVRGIENGYYSLFLNNIFYLYDGSLDILIAQRAMADLAIVGKHNNLLISGTPLNTNYIIDSPNLLTAQKWAQDPGPVTTRNTDLSLFIITNDFLVKAINSSTWGVWSANLQSFLYQQTISLTMLESLPDSNSFVSSTSSVLYLYNVTANNITVVNSVSRPNTSYSLRGHSLFQDFLITLLVNTTTNDGILRALKVIDGTLQIVHTVSFFDNGGPFSGRVIVIEDTILVAGTNAILRFKIIEGQLVNYDSFLEQIPFSFSDNLTVARSISNVATENIFYTVIGGAHGFIRYTELGGFSYISATGSYISSSVVFVKVKEQFLLTANSSSTATRVFIQDTIAIGQPINLGTASYSHIGRIDSNTGYVFVSNTSNGSLYEFYLNFYPITNVNDISVGDGLFIASDSDIYYGETEQGVVVPLNKGGSQRIWASANADLSFGTVLYEQQQVLKLLE